MATTQGRLTEGNGLAIRAVFEDDLCVIAMHGELDGSNAEALDAALIRAEESSATRVVLDLNGLTFIDSTGLRSLVVAKQRSDTNGDRLRMRAGRDQVQRVMALTGIDRYLQFEA